MFNARDGDQRYYSDDETENQSKNESNNDSYKYNVRLIIF